MTKIIIEWCDACKSWFVRCPRCGNNTCNGGSGEDGKCPLCIKVYEFEDNHRDYTAGQVQAAINAVNAYPSTVRIIVVGNEDIADTDGAGSTIGEDIFSYIIVRD